MEYVDGVVFLYKKDLISNDNGIQAYRLIPQEIKKINVVDDEVVDVFTNEKLTYIDELTNSNVGYCFPVSLKNTHSNPDGYNNALNFFKSLEQFFMKQDLYIALDSNNTIVKSFAIVNGSNEQVDVDLSDFASFLVIKEKEDKYVKSTELMTPFEMYDEVSKSIKSQDEQIKDIVSIIAKNQRTTDFGLKNNIIVCGSTGCGKTEIFRKITERTNVAICLDSAYDYIINGSIDIVKILNNLYMVANGDLDVAQKGVIVFDDIDKCLDDINKFNIIINEIKRLFTGTTIMMNDPSGKIINFNTRNLTVVLIGNLDLNQIKKIKAGFENNSKNSEVISSNNLKRMGLYPEFINDSDYIISLNDLDVDDLVTILKESDMSILMLYKNFFYQYGVNLIYDDDLIRQIALEAKKLGIGARGLKKIVDNMFRVSMFDVLSDSKYTELKVDSDTLSDNKKFILK